ncbi:MAG: polysaccharide deacetylase family protein [Acidobacteriota bacterium]
MLLLVAGLIAGLTALAHTAPFPFLIDVAGPAESIWRMPPRPTPTVYLTYDDGPNAAVTPALLDVLKREGTVATFFLIDKHVTGETAPLVRRQFAEGHAVALHTDTRAWAFMTPSRVEQALRAAASRIERAGGQPPCRAFRPHAGWRSRDMMQGLSEAGYVLVGWTWRMWDFNWYRTPHPEALAWRLAARASPGAIIVMHDGHHKNPRADRRHVVEATALLIPELRRRGFAFERVCGS